jgi:hypothetical protein
MARLFLATLLTGVALLAFPGSSSAQFAARGNLDCNGLSRIQKPLKTTNVCADPRGLSEYHSRFYENGKYIGHDEPSIGFYSHAPNSGNNFQWQITLPVERPFPGATQTLENYPTFWLSLALCDPGSFPQGPCIPDSDANNPNLAGSAFLEMQFYPPGNPPFINNISCDRTHWCASLHINSLECQIVNGKVICNPNCTETTNFAFIQTDGVPTGPPGPDTATDATFTPNAHTLMMNQGDRLLITIRDAPGDTTGGVLTRIDDLTTGQSGFMIASAANGYRSLNPSTCGGTNLSFHPEFATAKFGNFVPWAALQANVNIAVEIGHFEPGATGDNDDDDAPCFSSGVTVPGCLNFAQGGDLDFDGTSYLPDWPDGTTNNATSLLVSSAKGEGIGPLSATRGNGKYQQPYPKIQFETVVGASESTCKPDGSGCTVPPEGAAFYPFYATTNSGPHCTLLFGNLGGVGIDDFGGDAQYGTPNLAWFFGTNSGGLRPNPCIPHS